MVILNIIVTGSAGYLGSCLCAELLSLGHNIIGIDNYINSRKSVHTNLKKYAEGVKGSFKYIEKDVSDTEGILSQLNLSDNIDAIVHLAGLKVSGESQIYPIQYYSNNLNSTLGVCRLSKELGVPKILFSSTAAVYDENEMPPYTETSKISPKTVYGHTKYMSEIIFKTLSQTNGKSVVVLRYFNPVGCHTTGMFGEDKSITSQNLMSSILKSADTGRTLSIFGDNYPTKDGTCIRDFIHVMDLVQGHILALEKSLEDPFTVFNLGTGRPTTVSEIVNIFMKVTNVSLSINVADRRESDIPVSISDITKATKLLGYVPCRSVEDMCRDSWKYYKGE